MSVCGSGGRDGGVSQDTITQPLCMDVCVCETVRVRARVCGGTVTGRDTETRVLSVHIHTVHTV